MIHLLLEMVGMMIANQLGQESTNQTTSRLLVSSQL